MTCLSSTDGRIHVCVPSGHYIGQVRRFGARRWRTVTGKRQTMQSAAASAVRVMTNGDKRVRVLFVDSSPYYDPHVVFEGAA